MVNSIPRMTIGLSYNELMTFIINLFQRQEAKNKEEIIAEFEKDFAALYDMPQGVVLSKARVAFYYLLKHMNLKPGGEVLISALHVADFVNMINLAGFKPVVVDLKENSYVLDYEDLEQKINGKTTLLLVTHLAGYPADMKRIKKICDRYKIPFIEDCSQAVRASYRGQKLGTFGTAAIYSLSLLKSVCTLSGGMIISSNKALLDGIRKERQRLAQPPKAHLLQEAAKNLVLKLATTPIAFKWIVMPLLGMATSTMDFFSKFQKTNKSVFHRIVMPHEFLVQYSWQQAWLGLEQLKRLAKREEQRIVHAKYLYSELSVCSSITLPKIVKGGLCSFWLFPVLTEDPNTLKKNIRKKGVDSSVPLLSVLGEEVAFEKYHFQCEHAKIIKQKTLFLPMYPELSQLALEQIVNAIKDYQKEDSISD
jgi:dTDP-4-amino-4,6-dideoxygalactose transaminase